MFEVGDEVIVTAVGEYCITTADSYGIIVELCGQDGALIAFEHLTSGKYGVGQGAGRNSFNIYLRHVQLLHPKTKEERICNKINQMSARFDKRNQHESLCI